MKGRAWDFGKKGWRRAGHGLGAKKRRRAWLLGRKRGAGPGIEFEAKKKGRAGLEFGSQKYGFGAKTAG